MKFDTAWMFYRTNKKIAAAADVSTQAVSLWKKRGYIPIHAAVTLQKDSRGAIKIDPSVYTKNAMGIEGLQAALQYLKRR